MTKRNDEFNLTDLADLIGGAAAGSPGEAWLAAHPAEASEVEIARRVRLLMGELRAASVEVPEGFEARVMKRVSEDVTLLNLLDLALSGVGAAILELLAIIFDLLPASRPARPATS